MIFSDSGETIDCIHRLDSALRKHIDTGGLPITLFNEPTDLFVVRLLKGCDKLQTLINGHDLIVLPHDR